MARIVSKYTEITIDDLINNKLPKGVLLQYSPERKTPEIIHKGETEDSFIWTNIKYNASDISGTQNLEEFLVDAIDLGCEIYWFETEEEAIKFMASKLD